MARRRDIADSNPNTDTPSNKSRSWFFGIGIDTYQQFDQLNNAVKDVKDVLALLQERYDIDEVMTLFNEEADKMNILDQFEVMADELKAEDKLLIYYSGHGYLRDETGYWIPVDGRQGKRGSFIRDATVRDCIKSMKAKHILLISDSCFSGSLVTREIGREGLAVEELERDRSRWVISSGRQREKVGDGTPGKNSPFAASILKVLKENEQGKLNVAYLSDKVTKLTRFNYEQLPQGSPLFGVGHEGGQYVFCLRDMMPSWKKDWSFIANHSETTLNAINEKILLIDEYLEVHGEVENYEEAMALGELLEHKQAFYQARTSLFRLRNFAKKDTPFKTEALKLIEELKQGYRLPEEEILEEDNEMNHPETEPLGYRPARLNSQITFPTQALGNSLELKEKRLNPTIKNSANSINKQAAAKQKKSAIKHGTFTDPRDGQVYKTIELNGQTWLAENLNFDVGKGCWFYEDDPKNGDKYGRLYTWEAAQRACPPGWRLPSDDEWKALSKYYRDGEKAYESLIAGGDSGFSAQLGGNRDTDGGYYNLGRGGSYWSATERDADHAWLYWFIGVDQRLNRFFSGLKSQGLACRCVKDN